MLKILVVIKDQNPVPVVNKSTFNKGLHDVHYTGFVLFCFFQWLGKSLLLY